MIILTKEQADNVRGLTKRGHALAPRLLADGTYALPERCKDDPEHAVHSAFLKALPTRAVLEAEWETDPVKTESSDFKADWRPGEKVVVSAGATGGK